MEIFIITVLGLVILGLISQIISYNYKLQTANKKNLELTLTIDASLLKTKQINEELSKVNTMVISIKQERFDLEEYLKLFINERLKVYVHSNFHSNYNIYNGKFYAKISKRTVHNRAEAIPVLALQGSKYSVIDIYKLRNLLKLFPERSILVNLNDSKTLKETMIQELGNKVLTSHCR